MKKIFLLAFEIETWATLIPWNEMAVWWWTWAGDLCLSGSWDPAIFNAWCKSQGFSRGVLTEDSLLTSGIHDPSSQAAPALCRSVLLVLLWLYVDNTIGPQKGQGKCIVWKKKVCLDFHIFVPKQAFHSTFQEFIDFLLYSHRLHSHQLLFSW